MLPLLKKPPTRLLSHSFRPFSTQTTNYTDDPEFKQFVTEEELAKNEQLREKLHKFQREWKRLYEDYRQKDYTLRVDMLNEYQKKKVDYLVKQTQKLNLQEKQYFSIKIRDALMKTMGFNPLKLNANWPEFKALGNFFYFFWRVIKGQKMGEGSIFFFFLGGGGGVVF